MLEITTRPAARLAGPVLLAVLAVGGCGGETITSSATTPATTMSTTAAPPAPGDPPLTGEELAWLEGLTRLHKKIDEPFSKSVTLTPSLLRSWQTVLRSCTRELARLGSPSERLEPLRVLVQKACRQFDKAADCYAVAARNLNSYSKAVERKLNCGTNAQGDGSNLLNDAENKAAEIKATVG